ncbi:translation initiation factor IF-2 [Brevundimonas sp. BR2-1]|uniref:translation initiation factor IF-2 n=1 Tax=unclassified Brevundimonas TaxID=2622653 RepID=UPI002FC8B789
MPIRLVLAASAALAFAAPALAQVPPGAPPAPAPEAAAAEAEAAFEAKGEAFEAAIESMTREMQAAATAAGADTAKANADLDAIAARYQPQADAFADDLEAFIASQLPSMPAEAQAQMAQMGPMLRGQITGVPAATKARVLQAAASAAAPATPQ